ncbi:MAG: 4Fe-4S dicluster domain-containing protein [Phycisphaerae bacterium]
MLDAIIERSDFVAVVAELAKKRRIVGPVARDGHYFYEEVSDAARIDLDFTYCVYSPRGVVFPPTDTLFRFQRGRRSFVASPVFDERPTALVGVHPCDVHALRLLDAIFDSPNGCDEHYAARRRNLLVVGVDCIAPCCESAFCADLGTNAASAGFDVMLYGLTGAPGSRLGVVYGTAAGREWLQYGRRTRAVTDADAGALEGYQRAKAGRFSRRLTTAKEALPALVERSYDSLLWEATAARCYSCGSCNLVCPTCYCFNLRDELTTDLHGGRRVREWDACQLPAFAEVAGGHNFRPTAAARLRHRVNRKARWIAERAGVPGCVGCGRCDRACTAKISLVEIYNQLAEEA